MLLGHKRKDKASSKPQEQKVKPGVFLEAVAVNGGGANVEGVGGGVDLQRLSQAPVSLQSGAFLIALESEITTLLKTLLTSN